MANLIHIERPMSIMPASIMAEAFTPAYKEEKPKQKYLLTVKEAAQIYGIGQNKIRKIIREHEGADFILWNGNRSLLKSPLWEDFLRETTSI